jgi:hypothetical protein
MNVTEPLCDLEMTKAEYRANQAEALDPDRCFRINVAASAQSVRFDYLEKEGEVFAAEMEAVAAIIRSRVIRATLIGEEPS